MQLYITQVTTLVSGVYNSILFLLRLVFVAGLWRYIFGPIWRTLSHAVQSFWCGIYRRVVAVVKALPYAPYWILRGVLWDAPRWLVCRLCCGRQGGKQPAFDDTVDADSLRAV